MIIYKEMKEEGEREIERKKNLYVFMHVYIYVYIFIYTCTLFFSTEEHTTQEGPKMFKVQVQLFFELLGNLKLVPNLFDELL